MSLGLLIVILDFGIYKFEQMAIDRFKAIKGTLKEIGKQTNNNDFLAMGRSGMHYETLNMYLQK